MTFKTCLIFNADAPNSGGGGDTTATETKTDVVVDETKTDVDSPETKTDPPAPEAKTEPAQIPTSIISEEEMKSFGFNSKEELSSFLAKQKESLLSDEEKKQKADLDKANFLKFSTENKLLNVDDYKTYEDLKSTPDKDLVFKNFKEEFKADNPDITDAKELEEAAEEAFKAEYKLDSDSEATRKRGEAKLAKEANEIRSPFEKKVTTAQDQFKENNTIRETYPKFEKFVDEAIVKNTPDKTVLYKAKDTVKEGDKEVVKEIDVEIELTQADRDAIAKAFKTPKTFALFTNGTPEEVQAAMDKKIQGWIRANKFDEVASKSFEIGKGIGVIKGSTVGAENNFAVNQGASQKNAGEESLEESNQRLAKEKAKYQYQR